MTRWPTVGRVASVRSSPLFHGCVILMIGWQLWICRRGQDSRWTTRRTRLLYNNLILARRHNHILMVAIGHGMRPAGTTWLCHTTMAPILLE